MAESVSVTNGGVTITTNTASEADLRTEMEAPAADPSTPPGEPAAPAPPATGRDAQGRFLPKADAAAPPAEAAPAPEAAAAPDAPAPPARRRDDSLPRHNPIARLNQALAQKAEAERRAAQLEADLARYRQPPGSPQVSAPPQPQTSVTAPVPAAAPSGPPEPQFDQFKGEADPYTAYWQAWNRWDRAQTVTQEVAQALAERDAQQAAQTRQQTFETRLAEGRQRIPDFDQVLTQADTLGLQVSAVMREAITASPHAADLVHYLATHPEECTQLAEASVTTPVAAATVMPIQQLLEWQVQGHPAPRAAPSNGSGPAARAAVSTAKPPVTPVGSSPVASDEPPGDAASAAEHARYWNRRLKVPGTR